MIAMILLDRLIWGSVRFVLEKIAAAVDAELDDDETLRRLLIEAEMRLELGEITRDEFHEIERTVLARLREIRERREGDGLGAVALGGDVKVVEVGVEASGVESGVGEVPARGRASAPRKPARRRASAPRHASRRR